MENFKFKQGEFVRCICISTNNDENLIRGDVYRVKGRESVGVININDSLTKVNYTPDQICYNVYALTDKAGNLFYATEEKFESITTKLTIDGRELNTALEPVPISDGQRFQKVTNEMLGVYNAKNADYGDSFLRTFEDYGMVSIATRLSDKYLRLRQLVLTGKANVKDESVRDTLMDMANYAILTIMELDRRSNHVSPEEEIPPAGRPMTKKQQHFIAGLTQKLSFDRTSLPSFISPVPDYHQLTEAEAVQVIDRLVSIQRYLEGVK